MTGRCRVANASSVASLSLTLVLSACGGTTLVERAYDGRVVQGRAIEPEAYAAFLDGAMAEASDDRRG
ncbi:MAG TPA: hypothetical protein VII82_02545, partial [Polyangiaceae bacterium]